MRFESIYKNLDSLSSSLLGDFTEFSSVAMAIAGIGALFYISYRVWGHLARAEEIDLFPLLRPFALGLCILNFSAVTGAIEMLLSPITTSVNNICQGSEKALASIQAERDRAEENWYRNNQKAYLLSDELLEKEAKKYEGKGWMGLEGRMEIMGLKAEKFGYDLKKSIISGVRYAMQFLFDAVILALRIYAVFALTILAIFGPIVFGFAVFDGFQQGVVSWISRYISISLWLPVSEIIKSFLNKVNGWIIQEELAVYAKNFKPEFFSEQNLLFILFYIIGITSFLSVPTMAGWIVEGGGGTGSLGNKVAGLAGLAANGGAAFAGGTTGAVAGQAGQMGVNTASSIVKGTKKLEAGVGKLGKGLIGAAAKKFGGKGGAGGGAPQA